MKVRNYMAILRNIRNILEAKVDSTHLDKVYRAIADEKAVRKSRQLPFRFLSAYNELSKLGSTDSAVLDALESAIDASLANIQPIPGKSVIAIDVSGSMSSPISGKSDIRCCEIAMLIGLIANRLCESAVVYTFDTRIQKLSVPKRSGLLYAATHESMCGGDTNMDLPFTQMLKDKLDCDRVIIISDNMCNSGGSYYCRQTVQTLADRYRRDSGNDIWVHAIDLMGYGTQQFAGPKTNIVAGWSEKVFDFIVLAEQGEGSLEKTIAAYRW